LIDKKLISQQDFDTYKTDAAASQAQVALDKAAVELAQINLNYCLITSPIDGVTGRGWLIPATLSPPTAAILW